MSYYEELGVQLNSSNVEIKKAYYLLALKYHPDKNNSDEAKAKFQRVNHIYSVLSNPQKRADYDRFGEEGLEDDEDGSGSMASEIDDENDGKPLTVEDIQNMLDALGVKLERVSVEQLKTNINFKSEMDQSGVYTTDILKDVFEKSEAYGNNDLTLERKSIKSIPAQIGSLASLTHLNIKNNKLTSLPKEFSALTNLIVLDLSVNQFANFPPMICNLTNLEKLNMQHNRISVIPDEIENLVNLKTLEFFANQLKSIPTCMENLTKLEFLDIELNHINGPLPKGLIRSGLKIRKDVGDDNDNDEFMSNFQAKLGGPKKGKLSLEDIDKFENNNKKKNNKKTTTTSKKNKHEEVEEEYTEKSKKRKTSGQEKKEKKSKK